MIFFSHVDNCRRWQVKENPSLPDSFSWVFEGEYRKPKRQARFRPASGYWGRGFLSFCAPPPSTYFFASQQLWFGTFSPAKETQTRQPATQEQESAGERRMADMIIPRIICRIYLVRGNPAWVWFFARDYAWHGNYCPQRHYHQNLRYDSFHFSPVFTQISSRFDLNLWLSGSPS